MTRLVQLSDCHLCADHNRSFYNVNPYEALKRVLHQVVGEKPDCVLITGDISGDDSRQSYQHFLTMMDHFLPDCPWRVIPGNHDATPLFSDVFTGTQLTAGRPWTLHNWQVHGLDTRFVDARGKIDEKQLAAVTKAMESHPHGGHLLALHHHIAPTGSWMDKHSLANPEVLLSWLGQNHKPVLLIHGHIHAPLQYTLGKSTVLAAPSTCWQWALNDAFAVAPSPPGYRLIELLDDGTWSSWIRRVA
ncbi:metallophosphoesterase family protein [Alteromonas sp. 14N.309.X.WAT.G.H12]|uniref:metallophosphoesterase family protein n=1 Tax=Alteromonas sp. 14N.309.X.WAT.G.H12 TaxID=3120824 RepID=UPI002FD5F246